MIKKSTFRNFVYCEGRYPFMSKYGTKLNAEQRWEMLRHILWKHDIYVAEGNSACEWYPREETPFLVSHVAVTILARQNIKTHVYVYIL